MNVFVLCTGRCGSNTFAHACKHINNFSVGHESRRSKIYDRVKYEDNHIEVDNRLSWFLGRLDHQYGDRAFYVHLKRDRQGTAESFARRYDRSIIEAYRKQVVWEADSNSRVSPIDVCRHYYDTVNTNIGLFLKDKTNTMQFRLESAEDDFRKFWTRIGAKGDISASVQEWNRKYNASNLEEEASEKKAREMPSLPVRVARKAARVVKKFPAFLREA